MTLDFSDLYRSYYPKLILFCRPWTGGNAEEAEDLAQDILLKAYRGLKDYDPSYSLATWIYRIARNHCIDHRRRQRPGHSPGNSGAGTADSDRIIRETANPCAGTDPAIRVIRSDEQREVRRFIEGLSQRDRSIAFLHYYEDMGYREISGILRMPEGSIKYRVHAIKRELKRHMEKHYG